MRLERQAAEDAGARQHAAEGWDAAEGLRQRAEIHVGNEDYAAALDFFVQARDMFAQVTGEAAAAAAAAAAAEEPEPEEEPAPVSADVAIRDLIEIFRQAFEQGDLDRMSAEVYRGSIPRGERELFSDFFGAATQLSVAAEIARVRIADDSASAVAEVELATEYRHATTGASHSPKLRFRLRLVSGPGGWKLERAERR
jgi:hypothetical protein